MTGLRPWMLWAAAVALVACGAGVQTVRLSGAEAALSAAEAAHENTLREFAEATAKALGEARRTESALRNDIERIQADAAKEMESAKAREDALVESVRTGNRRLSIRAVCPAGSGGDAAVAGGRGAQIQRAEIDPADGVALVGIARDGDQYIRERNACVAAYEAVRERINAGAAPGPAGK